MEAAAETFQQPLGEYAHTRPYFYHGISPLHGVHYAGNGLSIGQEVLTHALLGMDGRHRRKLLKWLDSAAYFLLVYKEKSRNGGISPLVVCSLLYWGILRLSQTRIEEGIQAKVMYLLLRR